MQDEREHVSANQIPVAPRRHGKNRLVLRDAKVSGALLGDSCNIAYIDFEKRIPMINYLVA